MEKIKFISLIVLIIIIGNPHNYRELDDLGITSAIAIDYQENEFLVSVQMVNTKKISNTIDGPQPSFYIYQAKGKTLQQAFRNIVLVSPKRIYAGHNQILVISEEVARQGIYKMLDFFTRDPEFQKQFFVLVSKDSTAHEVISILTPTESLNANKLKDSLRANSTYLGISELTTFENLLATYLNPRKEITLPSITIKNNKKEADDLENINDAIVETQLELGPLAIFKNDKLIDFLSKKESIAFTFYKNKIRNTILTYECDQDKYISTNIINSNTKINMEKERININIESNANLTEVSCNINIEKDEVINNIQEKLAEIIKSDLDATIKRVIEENKTDIFGFEEIQYKNNNRYYQTIKEKWENNFLEELEISVNVKVKITEKGNALTVIKRE